MISVIVPVYNVESYLGQCLDSILAQTYRDIELILVDDGSTDGCPQICDAYREKDNRVVVFHTENRGLSAARNLGLDHAHGEWIMFVDSDDWVEPDFCRLPYEAAVEHGADLVIFEMAIINLHGHTISRDYQKSGIISAETAVECGHSAAWNKLYHRPLFTGIRYPIGQVAEDTAITHRLVYKARTIVYLNNELYYYRKRKESISEKKDAALYYDLYKAYLQKYNDLLSFGYPKEKLQQRLLKESLDFLMRTDPTNDPIYQQAEAYVSSWEGSLDGLKVHERNALKIWRLNKQLFHTYCRERGWKANSIGAPALNNENIGKEC